MAVPPLPIAGRFNGGLRKLRSGLPRRRELSVVVVTGSSDESSSWLASVGSWVTSYVVTSDSVESFTVVVPPAVFRAPPKAAVGRIRLNLVLPWNADERLIRGATRDDVNPGLGLALEPNPTEADGRAILAEGRILAEADDDGPPSDTVGLILPGREKRRELLPATDELPDTGTALLTTLVRRPLLNLPRDVESALIAGVAVIVGVMSDRVIVAAVSPAVFFLLGLNVGRPRDTNGRITGVNNGFLGVYANRDFLSSSSSSSSSS